MKKLICTLSLMIVLTANVWAGAPGASLVASRIEGYMTSRNGAQAIAEVMSNPTRLMALQRIENLARGAVRRSPITAKTSAAEVASFLVDAYKQSKNPLVQQKINELFNLESVLAPTAEEQGLADLNLIESSDAARANKIAAEINNRLAMGDISSNLAAQFEAAVQKNPARLGEGLLGSCKNLNKEQLANLMQVVVAGSEIADDAAATKAMVAKLAEVTRINETEAKKNLCDLGAQCDFIRSKACSL